MHAFRCVICQLYNHISFTFCQAAIGNGAGAVERVADGSCDEAQVKQAVVKAGFTPVQADDALRAVGPSLQVISRQTHSRPSPAHAPSVLPVVSLPQSSRFVTQFNF